MPAKLFSLLLLVLTRDGLLHKLDGVHDSSSPAAHATSIALAGGKLAMLADGHLSLDGKRLRGDFHDVRALAGGTTLWALTTGGVARVDPRSGALTMAMIEPKTYRLTAEGDEAFAEVAGNVIVQVSEPKHRWKVTGRAVAITAGDGKLFVATKEGPLWQIDRATGQQTQLGMGDWWVTLALAYGDGQLYAVTLSGKLWRIDPNKREKTIVAMDGWQSAIDLAVMR